MVELVERLIGKGYQVAVYDKNVSLANLQGANRAYIEQEIPHIASLMCDTIEDVLAVSEVIIIGNGAAEFRQALSLAKPEQIVIDLVRIAPNMDQVNAYYDGICW
jgi:GDP-mannose 6-dehydrogenase